MTRGYASYGIALQSIGGGGGVAHEGSTFGLTDTVGLNSDVSVTRGVDFGNGVGSANYTASANSASANGSIAFGAADMPNSKITGVNADRTKNDYGTYSYEKTTAGNGGSGSAINLGTASAPMQGSVQTYGNDAMAVFGHSIGGLATLGCSNASPTNANHFASACWGNTQVSGTAGQPDEFVGGAGTNGVAITVNSANDGMSGGSSGEIQLFSQQTITTYGHRSMGMMLQSIAGGGGAFSGPNRRIHSVEMPTTNRGSRSTDMTHQLSLRKTSINTYGDGAWGLMAQSVLVGFGAGYALNYLTSTNFSSNGQFADISVSAKKQMAQWEFGASLGFAQGWFQNNRYRNMGANGAAEAMDGVFASNSRMSIMGLRLRSAYEHELQKNHYLKPYVDIDLSYSSMPGFSETGTAPLALQVGSSSRWNVAITPMLEYGLDVLTADKTRVKLFASAGASFLPNNSHKSETSFVGASAALGTFDVITDGPEILGRLNLGIQAFQRDDFEVRAQYGLLAGDGYWSQSVSANLVWRF